MSLTIEEILAPPAWKDAHDAYFSSIVSPNTKVNKFLLKFQGEIRGLDVCYKNKSLILCWGSNDLDIDDSMSNAMGELRTIYRLHANSACVQSDIEWHAQHLMDKLERYHQSNDWYTTDATWIMVVLCPDGDTLSPAIVFHMLSTCDNISLNLPFKYQEYNKICQ